MSVMEEILNEIMEDIKRTVNVGLEESPDHFCFFKCTEAVIRLRRIINPKYGLRNIDCELYDTIVKEVAGYISYDF